MSTQPINSSAIRDLAATITRTFDTDRDGKLSASEFGGFLSQFLGALQNDASAAGAVSRATAAAGANVPVTSKAADRPVVGVLSGFDHVKMANPAHTTTKYLMGRIFQYHPNTPEGLRQALPEIQQLVPGVKIIGSKGDKLDFGDYIDPQGNRIGVIDVIEAAGDGGRAWWWGPVE